MATSFKTKTESASSELNGNNAENLKRDIFERLQIKLKKSERSP